jgi:branched-chain amino acid transport system substrate-binding protein
MKSLTGLLCALALAVSPLTARAAGAPLKVAIIETLSGPQASTGLMYRAAVRYEFDRINAAGGWNGQPVQVLDYDSQGGPVGASDKVRSAIADGAQILVQGSSSAIGGQITEDVRKHNLRNPGKEVVYLNVGAEALELTGDKCHFYHFRFCGNAQIRVKSLVTVMKQTGELGSRVYSMNQNYSWGQDMERTIVESAPTYGYQVVEKTLHDVNKIQDFAPYVAKIKAANAETVITGNWSNDLLLLMKATQYGGLKVRFGTVFLDQVGNLANAGDTALGHYVVHMYNLEAAGADGAKFAEEYRAKTGHIPTYVEPSTVIGMMMVGEALKVTKPVDGKMNITEFAKNLEKAKVKTPLGEHSMRAGDHQIQAPFVVSKVTTDAKYKMDGTPMGFKPVRVLSAEEASAPLQASCKMQRP